MTIETTLSAERLAELDDEAKKFGADDYCWGVIAALIAHIREIEAEQARTELRLGHQLAAAVGQKRAAESALAAARQREARLREALAAVVSVADRNTREFGLARAALTETGHDR